MKILLATPLYASHWDAGHFWLKALNGLGHTVLVWDYRLNPLPRCFQTDFTLVMKGESIDPEMLPHPRVCYWPDALERTPGIEKLLSQYDKVFTPVRPTPADMEWLPSGGMEWLPSGWDEDIHRYTGAEKDIPSVYIGTYNSWRKVEFLRAIRPDRLVGNGWDLVSDDIYAGSGQSFGLLPPQYLHDFVALASRAQVLINIHQGPVGLNRKIFEMISCGLTITDRVPGVEEIFGQDLAQLVSYRTPEEGHKLLKAWLGRPQKERDEIWQLEKKAIEPYTYREAAERILSFAG